MKNKHKPANNNKLRSVRPTISSKKKGGKLAPQILNKLKTLKKLLTQQDSKCWEIGDQRQL